MINSIEISLRSFEYSLLKSAILQIKTICPLGYSFSQVSLPTVQKKFTVLRSPHIDKKSREQFEIKYYKNILNLSPIISSPKSFLINDGITQATTKLSDIRFFIENIKRIKFTGAQVKIRIKYTSFLEKSFSQEAVLF